MHLNLSHSIGTLSDKHHEFKDDVTGNIEILQKFTKRLGKLVTIYIFKMNLEHVANFPNLHVVPKPEFKMFLI